MHFKKTLKPLLIFTLIFLLGMTGWVMAQKKALTYQDIMSFKRMDRSIISEDGFWAAYSIKPDRGDGKTVIRRTDSDLEYTIERGARPLISRNSVWVAAVLEPPADEGNGSSKKKTKPGMVLLNTTSGEIKSIENVLSFAFSDDSRWLAYRLEKGEEKKKESESKPAEKSPEDKKDEEKIPKLKEGTNLVLFNLESKEELQVPYVLEYAFDPTSRFLAYVLAEPVGKDNGLFFIELGREGWARKTVLQEEKVLCSHLAWAEKDARLAFLSAQMKGEKDKDLDAVLWIWDAATGKLNPVVKPENIPSGWFLPENNRIQWSRDGRRVFFGFKPEDMRQVPDPEKKEDQPGLFDVEAILEKSEVDVWHWNDPLINTHQKNIWPRMKNRTYTAVYSLDSRRTVQLADLEMPDVQTQENGEYALGRSDVPYRKEITWYGGLDDLYHVNIKTGLRVRIASRTEDRASLSPGGRYVVFYKDLHWHLFDGRSGEVKNLTKEMNVPFYDEDHDFPSKRPGYGVVGWFQNDQAVLINDKYDIWMFPVRGGGPEMITEGLGRKQDYTFRVIRTDPDQEFFSPGEKFLLSAYHNLKKNWGFYSCIPGKSGVERLLEGEKKYVFKGKAKNAETLLFSREDYQEFPDLWISDPEFNSPKKISEVNPQIADFAWGSAELVEWKSVDGIPLQGILIKPGNYEKGKRYPVIVYYYRFFSQLLYGFNEVTINHRPCFPFYTSNGYAVFLPDIRFRVGLPGPAATKCLVPGVQKLVDMGIADPDAIGLHGHSWSGYQTAFVITQSDIFKCAVAGAPVSNMTSAYSGIRWGTGMARQFQYEQSQSRIGGSLWEKRDLYIENSPVFYADRINTPLLIIFGDEDGAVPWYQGIELYLAMRRFEKDCVFLQYRGELHHPQKYPNKLDWFKKMKEYFDHYLKGAEGPDWITKGVPYRGK